MAKDTCVICGVETPVPIDLIRDTPNDMELGEKVRRLSDKY